MLISAARIRASLAAGPTAEIAITRGSCGNEFDPVAQNVTSVGYDVTLGCENDRAYDLTAQRFLALRETRDGSRFVRIEPGHTVSVQTSESLRLGPNVAALVHGKVRMVSRGMSPIATTIDPNWEGPLLLTFTYHGRRPFELFVGDPIATIVFFEVDQAAESTNDARARNNNDRWIDYSREEDQARQGQRKTRAVMALAGVVGFLICVMVVAVLMRDLLTSNASTLAGWVREVLGDTRRQQVEAISWAFGILVALSAILGGFTVSMRFCAAALRRLFGDSARLPEARRPPGGR